MHERFDVIYRFSLFSLFLQIDALTILLRQPEHLGVGIYDHFKSCLYSEDFPARPPIYFSGPFDR